MDERNIGKRQTDETSLNVNIWSTQEKAKRPGLIESFVRNDTDRGSASGNARTYN